MTVVTRQSWFHHSQRHWLLSLFVLFFLPLLVYLGFWQIDRAQEKQRLLSSYQEQQTLALQSFSSAVPFSATHYQPLLVEGVFDSTRYWLLDNKPNNGRVGYEVIMPLNVAGKWLLVNRGWVAAAPRRDQLPAINTPNYKLRLQGHLHQPSANAVLSSIQSDLVREWPKRVLQMDYDSVANSLTGDVFPIHFRLNDEESNTDDVVDNNNDNSLVMFSTEWPLINTNPEKHQAYAAQWFAMAFALMLLYGWVMVKDKRDIELNSVAEK